MTFSAGLIIGLIAGWIIEWIIDLLFWRSENKKLQAMLDQCRSKLLEKEVHDLSDMPESSDSTNTAKGKEVVSKGVTPPAFLAASAPATSAISAQDDPLEEIIGITPEFARHLKGLGIHTFMGLAKTKPNFIHEWLQVHAKTGQEFAPEKWVAQARQRVGLQVDDLEKIKGIGPIYAKKLNSAGIYTYVELAKLSPEQVISAIDVDDWQSVQPDRWIAEASASSRESGKKLTNAKNANAAQPAKPVQSAATAQPAQPVNQSAVKTSEPVKTSQPVKAANKQIEPTMTARPVESVKPVITSTNEVADSVKSAGVTNIVSSDSIVNGANNANTSDRISRILDSLDFSDMPGTSATTNIPNNPVPNIAHTTRIVGRVSAGDKL